MKHICFLTGFSLVILLVSVLSTSVAAEKPRKTENVIFVMTDGFRWQEMFGGADESIIHAHGNKNAALDRAFWRTSPESRRERSCPSSGALWPNMGKSTGTAIRRARHA